MKRNLINMFLTFGALCTFAHGMQAQSYRVTADVPFAFHLRGVELKAGHYLIANKAQSQINTISASHKSTYAFLARQEKDPSGKASMTFHCYGNDCYLAAVSTADGNRQILSVSKQERAARERVTTASIVPEEKVIYASLR